MIRRLSPSMKAFGRFLSVCPCPSHRWNVHGLMLVPLLVLVLITGFSHGFWGEDVRVWHETLRQMYPPVTATMRAISNWSDPALFLIYAALLLQAIRKGDRDTVVFVLRFAMGTALFAMALTQLLKAGFGMPRPGFPLPPAPFSFLREYSSFPSGHTVAIITAALPLAFYLGKKRWLLSLALLVAAVGYSRIWLGMHHPVDILGGILVGSLAARCIFVPRPETDRRQAHGSCPPLRVPRLPRDAVVPSVELGQA